jgi:hypothetical protein
MTLPTVIPGLFTTSASVYLITSLCSWLKSGYVYPEILQRPFCNFITSTLYKDFICCVLYHSSNYTIIPVFFYTQQLIVDHLSLLHADADWVQFGCRYTEIVWKSWT